MAYMWISNKNIADDMCIVEGKKELNSQDYSKLVSGITLDSKLIHYQLFKPESKKIDLEKLFSYDMLRSSWNAPLVNRRVVDLLNEYCADKIQIIDSEIELPDGRVNHDYKTINIINRVPVFTWEGSVKNSRYEDYKEPDALSMKEIAFDGKKIDEEICCRDSVTSIGRNLISNSLGNAMKKAKFKGLRLEKAIYGYHIEE